MHGDRTVRDVAASTVNQSGGCLGVLKPRRAEFLEECSATGLPTHRGPDGSTPVSPRLRTLLWSRPAHLLRPGRALHDTRGSRPAVRGPDTNRPGRTCRRRPRIRRADHRTRPSRNGAYGRSAAVETMARRVTGCFAGGGRNRSGAVESGKAGFGEPARVSDFDDELDALEPQRRAAEWGLTPGTGVARGRRAKCRRVLAGLRR